MVRIAAVERSARGAMIALGAVAAEVGRQECPTPSSGLQWQGCWSSLRPAKGARAKITWSSRPRRSIRGPVGAFERTPSAEVRPC